MVLIDVGPQIKSSRNLPVFLTVASSAVLYYLL